MRLFDKTELIKEIAEELGLPFDEVEKAVKSQFQFVRDKMAESNLDQIRLPSFGRFYVKPGRVENLIKHGKLRYLDPNNSDLITIASHPIPGTVCPDSNQNPHQP